MFLYAKTKAELLLLVHNVKFADAVERGVAAAADASDPLEAVMAIVRPIVHCNRAQIENGRSYLRELVFGDPAEPHHGKGLELNNRAEQAMVEVLRRGEPISEGDAAQLARVISAVMFIAMTATVYKSLSDDQVLDVIRDQLRVLLRP